jgi:hypothetical protein
MQLRSLETRLAKLEKTIQNKTPQPPPLRRLLK